ncbi:MAG: RNA-directed DNA polymerase [Verrucomicrobiales bacterium]|nr:RNA-directed DNA polymerase [Verrucomicrobiales bacterium]
MADAPDGFSPRAQQDRRFTSGDESSFRIHRLKKRSGGFRTIYVPADATMATLRGIVPLINAVQVANCGPWVHGFFPGRSPVTNAKPHIGQAWTLTADLSDFFDSVRAPHLEAYLDPSILDQVLVDGATRQGLPTSPPCANLAAIGMDAEITSTWPELIYTRYADDLSFSGMDKDRLLQVRAVLPNLVARHGFVLHPHKTNLQDARFGRRVITGCAVGQTAIHATSRHRRRLRAALHSNPGGLRAQGLGNWAEYVETTSSKDALQ